MHILVIGGTRFIGPVVIRQLHEQGHSITVLHRGQTQAELPPGVQEILADRAQLPAFRNEFQRLTPDIVLDMIPFLEQDAQTVVETFQGIAQRVVAISSCDVYRAFGRILASEPGPADPIPLTEDSPLREKLYLYRQETFRSQDDPMAWRDHYDKILVERIIMSNPDLPGTILRLPMVYGPHDTQHRTFQYLKRMDEHRPAIMLGEEFARWLWTREAVENVAAAIALAVTNPQAAGRIYNVAEAHTLTIAEWVQAIGDAADWHGTIVTVPEAQLPTTLASGIATHQQLLIDATRIRNELGYQPLISQSEALKQTIQWERANPPSKIDPNDFDYQAEDTILASLSQNP
jgi:nucleoside-diphosphate-sugar epimerase